MEQCRYKELLGVKVKQGSRRARKSMECMVEVSAANVLTVIYL